MGQQAALAVPIPPATSPETLNPHKATRQHNPKTQGRSQLISAFGTGVPAEAISIEAYRLVKIPIC